MGSPGYQNDGDPRTSGPGFGLTLHPERLELPKRWVNRRFIFVNSMSDLFHKDVPVGYIKDVFAVMEDTPRHTYQVLTKRSHRMARLADTLTWPSNLWMGVTVESEAYRFRLDHLRDVAAAKRFVSAEPLIGDLGELDLSGIDWLIAGGESGPKARPVKKAWLTGLRDACVAQNTSFWFKQWGTWFDDGATIRKWVAADGASLDGVTYRERPEITAEQPLKP